MQIEAVNGSLAIEDVSIDLNIYPRSGWSTSTVQRYAEAMEAGDRFPPIVLERDTNRLLDGMHRYQAHRERGIARIDVEYHDVPVGIPTKLYAASLSTKHGDRITGEDLKEVARGTIKDNPDFSMKTVAQLLGRTRQTVSRWVGDITERRKEVRKVKALILSRAGWTQEQAGEFLGVDQATIMRDVNDNILHNLTEDLLREALEAFEDENGEFAEIAERIREEQIFATWGDEERQLLEQLRDGKTIVINMREDGHPNLKRWAEEIGLFVRIDRRSDWGNPFEMPADGNRETVIYNYEEYYLAHKPSLLNRLEELRGKALGCWCTPEACHGHVLQRGLYW